MKTVIGAGLLSMASLSEQAAAEQMYNPLKSTVINYNNKNFEKQVTLNREKGIGVVQYYKSSGKFFDVLLGWHTPRSLYQ